MSRAARALKNASGGVETNRRAGLVIQIEIVGFASEMHNKPASWYEKLAKLLAPIFDNCGIVKSGPTFFGQDAGFTLATPSAPQRMSPTTWNSFAGICGHQHVVENDHWDPGKFNLKLFIDALPSKGGFMADEKVKKQIEDLHDAIVEEYKAENVEGKRPRGLLRGIFTRVKDIETTQDEQGKLLKKIARKLDIDVD